MSLLGALGMRLVLARAGILSAEIVDYVALGRAHGKSRKIGGVGTHVSDETPLVKRLGKAHGGAHGQVKLAGGLLLEGRCGERRRGDLEALFAFHCAHGINGTDASLEECTRLRGGGKALVQQAFDLYAVNIEHSLHAIVGLGHESIDFPLAVNNQTEHYRLHAAGRQAPLDLAPQDGRELEAYQTVEHAAGLLGVDQIHIQRARILHCVQNSVLGNLVENDAPGLGGVKPQSFGKVPRNGLSLAVFIGCEPDDGSLVGELLELVHNALLVGRDYIFGFETVFYIYAQTVILQVTYMAKTGFHHKGVSQVLLNGFRLGGRLDYH